MKAALEAAGADVIALTEADSKYGAVETRQEAANVRRCLRNIEKRWMASW